MSGPSRDGSNYSLNSKSISLLGKCMVQISFNTSMSVVAGTFGLLYILNIIR
jgi:hypothetical protein